MRPKEICSEEGCERVVTSRGLCGMHYLRARRNGLKLGPNRTERVLNFVTKCLNSKSKECICPEFKSKSDYPSFVWNGVFWKVGWLVLDRFRGPRPEGMEMRHLCGNRRCCNPRHLQWGTHAENMEDWKKHGCAGERRGENNSNYRHGRYCQA